MTYARITLSLCLLACQAVAPSPEADDLSTQAVTYTLQGPALTIEEPALGAFVARTPGDLVHVAGTSRASSVTIAGTQVSVKNGRFDAWVPAQDGVNVVRAKASGILGNEGERAFLYGDYTPQGVGNAAGVSTRVNFPAFRDDDGKLNDLSSIATYTLSRVDMFDALQAPIVFHYDFVIGSLDMQVASMSYDGAASSLSLAPRVGGASTTGVFGKIGLDMALTLHLFGSHLGHAHVDVDQVDFSADVAASFANALPGVNAHLEHLQLNVGEVAVSTDLPGSQYLDAIIDWIAKVAHTQVAKEAAKQIEANAVNAFAVALNQLALPASFDLSAYGINANIAVSYALDGATFDADGAGVSAAPALSWPEGLGKPNASSTPGSLRIASRGVDLPHDPSVAVALSFDLMNQALYAVWGQGGFERTVWPGGKKWGVTFDPLTVSTALPPVLTPTADGDVALTVGDARAHTRISVLGFSGDIDVDLSLWAAARLVLAPEGDRLTVNLAAEPELAVDINHLLGVVPDVVITAMERLIEDRGPQIAASFMSAIAIPVPTLPLDQIKGFEGHKLAIGAPAEVVVDAASARVLVSGSFSLLTP